MSWNSPWLAATGILLVVGYTFFLRRRTTPVALYFCEHDVVGNNAPHFNLGDFVKQKVPVLAADFKPVWWLPEGNCQTIYTSLADFTHVDHVVYERKLLRVADGGVIAVDISPPLHSHPIQPNEAIVVIAHGLTGGSHEHYVRAAVKGLTAPTSEGGLAARAIVANFRGCNDSPVVTPKLYHAGSSDDIRPIVLWVSYTFPQCTIFGLGFSLGANIFTKYVGEESDRCPLSGLVSLANPWDFYEGGKFNESGSFANRFVYRFVLGGAMRSLYHRNRNAFLTSSSSLLPNSLLEKLFSMPKLSLVEFDNLITTRMFGFDDAWDYYTQVSSCKVLNKIRIPVFGINALDDPILGTVGLPYEEARRNPWLVLATTKHGGHMGWFERASSGGLARWYVKPMTQFFQALLECDLPPRPRPVIRQSHSGLFQEEGRPEVAFAEVHPETVDLFSSGDGESKLVSGW
ncbi:unnamed protein product [Somion occarium]|uniref:AB hydrolase-1 domain-containing protein n=1 Tax=Somion occarium TaxID=3059160 RepID=A0ABP1DCC6_9APHY